MAWGRTAAVPQPQLPPPRPPASTPLPSLSCSWNSHSDASLRASSSAGPGTRFPHPWREKVQNRRPREEVPDLEPILFPSGVPSHLHPQNLLLALPLWAILEKMVPRLGLVPALPALGDGAALRPLEALASDSGPSPTGRTWGQAACPYRLGWSPASVAPSGGTGTSCGWFRRQPTPSLPFTCSRRPSAPGGSRLCRTGNSTPWAPVSSVVSFAHSSARSSALLFPGAPLWAGRHRSSVIAAGSLWRTGLEGVHLTGGRARPRSYAE